MDLFGDDIDSLLQNNDELNENVRGSDVEDEGEANKEETEGEKDENGEPRIVEPKKRSVRNPRVSMIFPRNDKHIAKQWTLPALFI